MDPNTALKNIRRIAQDVRASAHYRGSKADELADAVHGLDEWLSRGGFLPSNWSDDTVRTSTVWSGPVVDSVLDVEVDGTLNIVLTMPARPGMRRRSVTLSDVDQLHAQLEEARIFVRGQEAMGAVQAQVEQETER